MLEIEKVAVSRYFMFALSVTVTVCEGITYLFDYEKRVWGRGYSI